MMPTPLPVSILRSIPQQDGRPPDTPTALAYGNPRPVVYAGVLSRLMMVVRATGPATCPLTRAVDTIIRAATAGSRARVVDQPFTLAERVSFNPLTF